MCSACACRLNFRVRSTCAWHATCRFIATSMKVRTKKWLIRASAIAVVVFLGLVVAAYFLSKRYEPQIRQQTIRYLEKRFSSEAEIKALHIVLLPASPRTVLF